MQTYITLISCRPYRGRPVLAPLPNAELVTITWPAQPALFSVPGAAAFTNIAEIKKHGNLPPLENPKKRRKNIN